MLPEIKRILYSTDLSQSARHAFEYAVSIARKYDAQISVIHILESPSMTSDSLVITILGKEKWDRLRKSNEKEALRTIRKRLEEFCGRLESELPECPTVLGKVTVKVGNPVEEILNEAEGGDYDLVVMGAHGLGFLATAMIGSTSRRVLKRCKKPVLVVRLPDQENQAE